jgi:HAMP domain-containing protein
LHAALVAVADLRTAAISVAISAAFGGMAGLFAAVSRAGATSRPAAVRPQVSDPRQASEA